jgi:NACHT domain
MAITSASAVVPAIRIAGQVASWAYRASSVPASPLYEIPLEVATAIEVDAPTRETVVLTRQQTDQIETFLSDPAVSSLIRLNFMKKWAPPEELDFLEDVASEATFVQLAESWCRERDQTWKSVAEHLWGQIEQDQDSLLARVRVDEQQHERAAEGLLQRFFFGRIGMRVVPEYVRRINELAYNPGRQTQLRDFIYECNRLDARTQSNEFAVMGIEQDSATFEVLYIDRNLTDAVTGELLTASKALDIGSANPRLVVIGDPGVGKSTLTSWAKWRFVSQQQDGWDGPRPSVITIMSRYDLTDANSSILGAIRAHFSADYLTEPTEQLLADLLSTGWVLLIVDGIDEILDQTQRRKIVGELKTLAQKFPFTPIICTTRRTGFEVSLFDANVFRITNLDQYTDGQVAEYAKRWFEDRAIDLRAERFLGESATLGELRRNPLMLALLCTLFRQYDYIPQSRREIYLRCAQLMFYEWDPRRGISIPNFFKRQGDAVLREIALVLHSSWGVGSSIDEGQLTSLIEAFLKDKGEEDIVASITARGILEHCSRRAWILTKVASSGKQSRFSFTHRTFFEFFAAEGLIRKINRERALWGSTGKAPTSRLSPVSEAILSAFRSDSTSLMPELLLQAADDLMGGMSTPVLEELQREAVANEREGEYLIGLCIRLIAAGGAHANVVDRVFDVAAHRWSDRRSALLNTDNRDSYKAIFLSDFRPLLDIGAAHRHRFIKRCLDDKAGLGLFFLQRYSRLAFRGEAGLFSDEWRECANAIARNEKGSVYDPIATWYRLDLGLISLDEAIERTFGQDLLILSSGDYYSDGVLWRSIADTPEQARRVRAWRMALKTLVKDRRLRADRALPIHEFVEKSPGVSEPGVFPTELALCLALLSPPEVCERISRISNCLDCVSLTGEVRRLRGIVEDGYRRKGPKWDGWRSVRVELSQVCESHTIADCPVWIREYVGGPYVSSGSLKWLSGFPEVLELS